MVESVRTPEGARYPVFFSTIAVYGNSNGQILTEDTPAKPDTFYARTKLAAERVVLDAKRVDDQPLGTVLRFAAIYGSRIKGNYQRLVQALARRRFIPIGDGSNRRTLIYDRDVAKAALLVCSTQARQGKYIMSLTAGSILSKKLLSQYAMLLVEIRQDYRFQ